MKQKYLITDPRPLESFKDKTFSDFKKLDVFKALYKSIETGKVENSCHWITECIISGYGIEVMEKLIICLWIISKCFLSVKELINIFKGSARSQIV